MAENKEITTLHPYMNRNKNRYPNVREENIPDTIQRKLTAGTGISISPENVISATGGDSYTRSETDALLDTKADKVALENVNKAVPTDIAVKDGKLGLEHNTTWLTNQNAITLGDGLTYDEATKTLKAEGSGATLPAGTEDDPFVLNTNYKVFIANQAGNTLCVKTLTRTLSIKIGIENDKFTNFFFYLRGQNKSGTQSTYKVLETDGTGNTTYILQSDEHAGTYKYYGYDIKEQSLNVLIADTTKSYHKGKYISVPTDKTESYYLNATYDTASGTSAIKWNTLKKTYNHYIVISDGTASNAIYLLIPSTNNIKCNSLTDLDTLLGTAQRFIQASGVVTNNASKLPIVALNWQGSIATSKILTMSSEEALTKFTNVVDVVELA